jgi:predicted aspartyl protease
LADSLQFMYHTLMLDNAIKCFDYKKAVAQSDVLEKKYAKFFKNDELTGMKEANVIWTAARDVKKQQIIHHGSSAMSVKRDMAGLMNVRVTSSDSSYNFVFDTGAGLSTIMESYAKKLQLDFLDAEVPVRSGITGIATQSRLAIARKLTIGNMEVRDALFLVFPDSALTFAKGLYKINGIIGFPIIKEMGELTFRKDSLFVPGKSTLPQGERNLAVDNLKPYFFLNFNGTRLPFTFDTGAGQSLFSDLFYRKYQQIIDSTGKAVTQQLGGTNGTRPFQGYTMPSLTFHWDKDTVVLKNVFVSKEQLRATGQYYYGNIGKDFINNFRSMTMDFKRSSLHLEK